MRSVLFKAPSGGGGDCSQKAIAMQCTHGSSQTISTGHIGQLVHAVGRPRSRALNLADSQTFEYLKPQAVHDNQEVDIIDIATEKTSSFLDHRI